MTLHALYIDIMDQSGVKPQIKGSYDLREDESLDHSICIPYRDRRIRYLQMHTKETHFS